MPVRASRLCPTCRQIVPGGQRCPECSGRERRAEGQRRGGANARGYTYAWQQLVARQLRLTPYCWLCGATSDLTGDHLVPLSHGGRSVASNVRILCRLHNSQRGART